jgi:two-component system KDP operon response regulator KdpE
VNPDREAETRAGRVLIVDDGDLGRTLIRTLLARAADPGLRSAELVEAGSIAEARAHLATAAFDVVLLDMRLPDGDGLTVLDGLVVAPGCDPPAFVAVTGDSSPPARARALAAGCDAFLTKPFRAAELLELVAHHLSDPGDGPTPHRG